VGQVLERRDRIVRRRVEHRIGAELARERAPLGRDV